MKKILLSLLLAGGVQNSFAMQGVGEASSASARSVPASLLPFDNALIDAARSGDLTGVKEQLANDANVNVQNAEGVTALMLAALTGHVDVVRELIARCANVNAKALDRRTALMMAARNGHTEIVQLLIDAGADVNARANYGRTALVYAMDAPYNRNSLVSVLFKAGAYEHQHLQQ